MKNEEELVINESNFADYFFDVRNHRPQPGQVMAKYAAMADFIDGPLKRNILEILQYHDAMAAPKIMRKIGYAVETDSYRIPIQMAQDLLDGVSNEEVARKPYRYTMEMFFYTKREYVPKNDPHWNIITLMNLDEFIDAEGKRVFIKTEVIHEKVQDLPPGQEAGDGGSVETILEG